MNPLARTVIGLGSGWIAHRGLAAISRLQGGHGETVAKKLHSRRSFTRNAALGATGIVLAQTGVAFVTLLWPNKTGAFGGEITISADNIPEIDTTPFRNSDGKFYIVRNEDGVQALYWKCVHLGCTVPWNEGEGDFHCPCHGSVFTYAGARTGGPATRRLDRMPITVNDDGSIAVDTNPGSLLVANGRTSYEPSDATPYP
jgi:cytochrome b6-f complex iron-sulfur subunit